ncbi:MAG: hypothetical protein ACRDHI_08185, partial [Actinomycetota bacterium]
MTCALVGAAATMPANADTEAELDSAEQQLAAARAELDRVNQLWQDAEADLARSRDAAAAAVARIGTLRSDLASIQQELNERAASLFIAGGSPQAMAVITSESVTDAVDRLEFASAIAEGDTDLATRVSVATQELAWEQDRLADAVARQSEALAALDDQQASIQAELERFSARVEQLEEQVAAEQAPPPTRGGSTGGGDPPVGDIGSPPSVTGAG